MKNFYIHCTSHLLPLIQRTFRDKDKIWNREYFFYSTVSIYFVRMIYCFYENDDEPLKKYFLILFLLFLNTTFYLNGIEKHFEFITSGYLRVTSKKISCFEE